MATSYGLERLECITTGLSNSSWCWSALWYLLGSLGVSSKVCESVCFTSNTGVLAWSSLDWSPGPCSCWDLSICQLFILCLAEAFPGVNWVLNIDITINVLKVKIIISNLTRETRCVCVFSLHTLRINVSILATSDAVSATCLLPEGTISSNIAKSETSILILVRITL